MANSQTTDHVTIANSSELDLHVGWKDLGWQRRMGVFAAAIAAYLLILHFLRYNPHIEPLGLVFEYLVLLPLVWWFMRGLRGSGEEVLAAPRVAAVLAVAAVAVCIPFALHEYHNPTGVDEGCYQFQARIFEAGRVVAAPLVGATANVRDTPEELDYQNHVLTPRAWFTHFPPGWPLLLVVGDWLHVPWLLNPLLTLLLAGITYWIANRTFSNPVAQLAMVFLVLSPFFLSEGARRLSHVWCGVLVAAACGLVFRGMEEKRAGLFAWAFALLALALHVRPYTAAAEAAVLGTGALWYMRADRRLCAKIALCGAVFGGLGAASTMLYYDLTTGNPLVSPYAARVGAGMPSELTFDPRMILYFMHTFGPRTLMDLLFGTFSFLFLLALYTLVAEKERVREVRIFAVMFMVVVVAYVFHTERSYSFYGSRFHYEAFFGVAILGARGVELLARRWTLPRRAIVAVVVLLGLVQVSKEKGMFETLWRTGKPYAEIAAAVEKTPTGLVFLHSGNGYNASLPQLQRRRLAERADGVPDRRGAGESGRMGVQVWASGMGRGQSG